MRCERKAIQQWIRWDEDKKRRAFMRTPRVGLGRETVDNDCILLYHKLSIMPAVKELYLPIL